MKIDPYFQRESILLHTTQTEACKLAVQDIHKRYGDNEVLKGVSLNANKGDVISIIGTPVGNYADRHVGTNKPVTITGLSLAGSPAGNYNFSAPTDVTGTITKKTLTIVGLSATAKVYDGALTAPLTGTGVLQSAITAGTGTSSDGKPYSVDSLTLTGTAVGA